MRGQKLLAKRTPQVFKTSKEINKKPELMNEYLVELEKSRLLRVGDKWITWLICGEVNILRNVQSDGNRAEFRFTADRLLSKRFRSIVNETDIFVNPTHTIMGNQRKLAMRRAYLSAHGRTFCSASNVDLTGKGRSNIG